MSDKIEERKTDIDHKTHSIQLEGNVQGRELFTKIVLVDDDELIIMTMKQCIFTNMQVDVYRKISDFLSNLHNYDKQKTAFIVDHQFKGEILTGVDVLKNMHELSYQNLYLFSGSVFHEKSIPSFINVILKTDIEALEEIKANIAIQS